MARFRPEPALLDVYKDLIAQMHVALLEVSAFVADLTQPASQNWAKETLAKQFGPSIVEDAGPILGLGPSGYRLTQHLAIVVRSYLEYTGASIFDGVVYLSHLDPAGTDEMLALFASDTVTVTGMDRLPPLPPGYKAV